MTFKSLIVLMGMAIILHNTMGALIQQCPGQQVFTDCVTCNLTCEQLLNGDTCQLTAGACEAGCTCPRGTYLNGIQCSTYPECVKTAPSPCPWTQYWSDCGGCVQTCADVDKYIACSLNCRVGCTCSTGYYLDGETCVTAEECRIKNEGGCRGDLELRQCSSACEPTCDDLTNPIVCIDVCMPPACQCPAGYYRDGDNCLTAKQCRDKQ